MPHKHSNHTCTLKPKIRHVALILLNGQEVLALIPYIVAVDSSTRNRKQNVNHLFFFWFPARWRPVRHLRVDRYGSRCRPCGFQARFLPHKCAPNIAGSPHRAQPIVKIVPQSAVQCLMATINIGASRSRYVQYHSLRRTAACARRNLFARRASPPSLRGGVCQESRSDRENPGRGRRTHTHTHSSATGAFHRSGLAREQVHSGYHCIQLNDGYHGYVCIPLPFLKIPYLAWEVRCRAAAVRKRAVVARVLVRALTRWWGLDCCASATGEYCIDSIHVDNRGTTGH